MSNENTQPMPNLAGAPIDPSRMVNLKKEDPFKDAPFYTFGESNSKNITAIPEGTTVNARLFGLRTSRVGKKSSYAVLKDSNGVMFRLFTQTALHGRFMDLQEEVGQKRLEEEGVNVSIKRLEKVRPEGGGDAYWNFEVLAELAQA